MSNEKMINVPLDEETKAVLETSARENGRAVGREAAMLVKRGLASFRRGLAPTPQGRGGRRLAPSAQDRGAAKAAQETGVAPARR